MAKPPRKSAAQKKQEAQKRLPYTMMSRLAKAMAKEFTLQGIFKFGYRNKEDVSNLPSNTLVVGSQNVLTNAAEQIVIRNGYQYDGPAGNQNTYGIDSAYDFLTKTGTLQNLRKWGSNLEVRSTNAAGTVNWVSLMSNLNAANVCNFTEFYDSQNEQTNFCLFVNGDNRVYEWTGASAGFASATSTTLTIQGTQTLAQLGFYNTAFNNGKMQFVLNGVTYTYTSAGMSTSTSFTGSGSTHDGISPTTWWDQMFTTGASAQSITQATLTVYFDASSAWTATQTGTVNFTCQLYTDNAGVPGTPVGGQVVASIYVGKTAGNYGGAIFNFQSIAPQGVSVSAATNYHFVVSCDQTQYTFIQRDTNGAQNTNKSTNSGGTWSASNGPLNVVITENDIAPQTFLGVTPDPTGHVNNVGDPLFQSVAVGTSISGISSMSSTFPSLDLISTLGNQIWYGSLTNNNIYVSKINNYTDTSSSTVRLPGEGALLVLDSPPIAFSPQSTQMYVGAGRTQWWVSNILKQTLAINNVATATEILYISRLKTAGNQAPQSQGLVARFKNSLVYVSGEPILNALGLVKNINVDPQIVNMSDPVKYDFDAYNFAGGQVFYDNYYIYVAVPKNGIVRLYNVVKKYWEAPQTIPISRFYHTQALTGDALFGHSSLTNESYQLFVPNSYNDLGNPIPAVAAFPYASQEGKEASQKNFFNKHYTEGYMSANTALTLEINYDFGAFSGTYSTNISGADKQIIFNKITDGSLGKNPLGTQPIGTILNLPNQPAVPKFRVIKTFPPVHCYEYQIVYSSNDVDQNWSLLRIGPAVGPARDMGVEITE